jgi:hypothetical protein
MKTCARNHLFDASRRIAFRYRFLPDRPELLEYWHALAKTFGIKGCRSHDARLVAAMDTYGISRLLTFNANDFKGFPITIMDPVSV